jgi:hypothetical protein
MNVSTKGSCDKEEYAMEFIIQAITQAMASLSTKHPETAVWLPEATYIQRGTTLDTQMWYDHYQQWFNRIAFVAGQVNVHWVRSTRIDENGVSQVCECYLSPTATVEPTRVIGTRK